MNQLNEKDIQQHIMIVGWLHIVGSAVFLLIGLFVFALLTGIGTVIREPVVMPILTVVGTAVGLFLAALSIPGLATGYGLLRRRPWARVLGIVVGVLNLINFPIGTAIGIYTLWVLLQQSAIDHFST